MHVTAQLFNQTFSFHSLFPLSSLYIALGSGHHCQIAAAIGEVGLCTALGDVLAFLEMQIHS